MKNQRGNYKSEAEKRTKRIPIKVTENEKKAIEKNAKKVGLSVSDFARQNLINGYVLTQSKNTQEEEKSPSNNLDRRTIIGLATNLNQLTKHVNSTHEIHPELMECLKAITAIINKG